VRDATGERLEQLAGNRHDVAAAQAAGQARESDRRSGYANDMLPTGAEYGDLLPLPPVPCASSKHTGPPPDDGGGYAC
jgi:hypothetical protein